MQQILGNKFSKSHSTTPLKSNSSAGQDTPRNLRNRNVHHRVHNIPSLVPIHSKITPSHAPRPISLTSVFITLTPTYFIWRPGASRLIRTRPPYNVRVHTTTYYTEFYQNPNWYVTQEVRKSSLRTTHSCRNM
jgi:hypothetical protein